MVRLSKVQQMAFFSCFTRRIACVELLTAVPGHHCCSFLHSLEAATTPFFQLCSRDRPLSYELEGSGERHVLFFAGMVS